MPRPTLMTNPAFAVADVRDGAVAPASSCRIPAPMSWSAFIGTAPFATTTDSSAVGKTRSGTDSRQTRRLIRRRQLRAGTVAGAAKTARLVTIRKIRNVLVAREGIEP